jgi:hypothetical protein
MTCVTDNETWMIGGFAGGLVAEPERGGERGAGRRARGRQARRARGARGRARAPLRWPLLSESSRIKAKSKKNPFSSVIGASVLQHWAAGARPRPARGPPHARRHTAVYRMRYNTIDRHREHSRAHLVVSARSRARPCLTVLDHADDRALLPCYSPPCALAGHMVGSLGSRRRHSAPHVLLSAGSRSGPLAGTRQPARNVRSVSRPQSVSI